MVVCADTCRRHRRRRRTMQPQHNYCYGLQPHREPPPPPPPPLHLQDGGQPPHRDPPPYPGHFRPLYQPGYRQSYSGSETSTDLSLSSTENLSTSTRQDPQGEETTAGVTTPSLEPWDHMIGGEFNYGLLSQLANMPTSGVEVKSTNSATFYVTGSRPTSASPNQELLHWTGEMPPGGFCGNSLVQERVPVMTGAKVYQPNNTSCITSGKTTSGCRPQSAHGAPGQRREMYVVPPRPASVNANPFPGASLPDNSPPKVNYIQSISRKQSRPVSTAAATTAAAIVSATIASSPPAQVNYPPPPQYPGTGLPTNTSTRTKNEVNSASINANGTKITVSNMAPNCKQQHQQQQHQQQQGATHSLSATPIISPTASANTSPNISTATSPVVSSNHSSPSSTTNPASGPVLSPPGTKSSGSMKEELCRSYDALDRSQRTRSQPDLLCLNNDSTSPARLTLPSTNHMVNMTSSGQRTPSPQPASLKHGNQQNGIKKKVELDHALIATRATQMVERLSDENRQLRRELEGYYRKVSKLQKFEVDIQKVHESHEALMKQAQRREGLEKIMRFKLEAEVRKFSDTNKELKDQLKKALSQLEQKQGYYDLSDSDLKKEIQRKDSLISKLISQNKELSSAKERLEIEAAAQRSTLQEQRTHIEVLDTAIVNGQSQTMRLEEDLRRKASQEDTVTELQRAVAGLQLAAEKKDNLYQRLLAKLEEEISNLQGKQLQASLSGSKTSDSDEGISTDSEPAVSTQILMQQLQKKDQRILQLEVEIVKLEERYLEEHALRQLAVDAASLPKDARIAALEQNSTETGKIIAEAKSDRLKHLEEIYQSNRNVAELEAKLKTCQAQLAEKDAMIQVMQKHNSLSRAGSLSSLLYSPLHSPRPSLASSLASSLTSPLASSVVSCSSSSAPVSSPPSGASSRQGSQLDTSPYREARQALHNKSNSTGSAGLTSVQGSNSEKEQEAKIKELKQRLAAQTALFQTLQLGSDQLSKCLWQV